jgi:hypothetical protein
LGFTIAGINFQQQDEVRGGVEGAVHSAKGNESASKGYWHWVACWSWSMSPVKQKYVLGNQEMLAIIMSCCRWRHYLKGARHLVEVLTDHHIL